MKTKSWSQIARENAERLVDNYNSYETEEEKLKYKKFVFEELFNPMRDGEFVGYWRSPVIQNRIAKMWRRKITMKADVI